MDEFEASTRLRASPEEAYPFLADFERYAKHSKYLSSVSRDGDGGPGTEYFLRFEWWVARYDVRARVTETDPPRRLAFELTRGIAAEGDWTIEPASGGDPGGDACRVRFRVGYDPGSVVSDAVDLPAFVPLGAVIERATPLVEREARRILEGVAADLEGERRALDIRIS